MRILMVTTKRYPPQFYGGAEMSTHSMCMELQRAGHEVAVLAQLAPRGALTWKNRLQHLLKPAMGFPADHGLGYPVHRGWLPAQGVEEMLQAFAPDMVFAQSGEVVAVAEAFARHGLPVFVFLRHAHYHALGGVPRKAPAFTYFANSRYCAERYQTDFGLDCHLLTPVVLAERYRTTTDRSRVVYVNPSPMKGVDLVLALAARRPDIPFDIVESWTLPEQTLRSARARAAALPNVRWLKPRDDMRQVYGHARLLLAPSGVGHPEWIEAWGRVATEAQYSGIPVLASNSGGLPEAVGPGGLVVDLNASEDEWLLALGRLWDDRAFYEQCSQAALLHAARPEIDPGLQMQGFGKLLAQALARHQRSSRLRAVAGGAAAAEASGSAAHAAPVVRLKRTA